MTIKQQPKKIKFDFNFSTIIFLGTIILSVSMFVSMLFGFKPGNLVLVVISGMLCILFLDNKDIKMPKNGFITSNQKTFGWIVAFVFLFMSILMAISNRNAKFIEMVKKEHPVLSTDFSKCKNKENIVIDEYKMYRESETYYVKTTDNHRFKLLDLKVYDYEEF